MICLAVFFLAFTLLLQDNLGSIQMELNYRNFGNWFCYTNDRSFAGCKKIEKNGKAFIGSYIFALYPFVNQSTGEIPNDFALVADEDGDELVKPHVFRRRISAHESGLPFRPIHVVRNASQGPVRAQDCLLDAAVIPVAAVPCVGCRVPSLLRVATVYGCRLGAPHPR